MTITSSESPASQSRLKRGLGLCLGAVLLTALFVYLGFPYERLIQYVLDRSGDNQAVDISFESASSNLEWLGPGIEVEGVTIIHNVPPRIYLGRVALRPAWSFSWFRGVPSIHATVEALAGEIDANIQLEDPLHVTGTLFLMDASALPLPAKSPEIPIRGPLEIDFDLSGSVAGDGPIWEGTLALRGEDGSVVFPDFPVAIPYTELEGLIRLGGDSLLSVEVGRMEGPLVNATVSGVVNGDRLNKSAIVEMLVTTESDDASVQKAMRDLGLEVDPDGKAQLSLAGTLASPKLR
jgi:type II secretion system protein N